MGRRVLALLCCATLLLISSSAVGGVLDENVRHLGRFAGRLGRQHVKLIRVNGDVDEQGQWRADPVEENKAVEADEKKPAEGFLEKARSFLSGISTSVGNGIPNPAEFLFPKRGDREEAADEVVIGKPLMKSHRGSARSHWSRVRDLIRNHPEMIFVDGISATEPLSLDDDVTSEPAFQQKIGAIVSEVVEAYKATDIPLNLLRPCVDSMEEHVKGIVKHLKVSVRGKLCNGDLAGSEEREFCNFFNDHSLLALMTIFAKTAVNPIEISWEKLSQTAVCSSVDPTSEFLDNLSLMQGLASNFVVPEAMPMEHDHEHHMFHKHRHEHGHHWRNWWQRILHKDREMKHHRSERRSKHLWYPRSKEEGERGLDGQDNHENFWWQRMMGLQRHMSPHHHEDENEHDGKHGWHHGHEENSEPGSQKLEEEEEKHRWGRMFGGLLYKHRHMRHHGFEHAHGKDCYFRSIEHLDQGVRRHVHATCEMTRDPNVMNACKFADDHGFLVMAWLAAELPALKEAAGSCAHRHDASRGSYENEVRHAPNLGIAHFELVDHPVDAEDLNSDEARLNTFSHRAEVRRQWYPVNADFEQQWLSRACARQHTNRVLIKALHLRGHVVGISSSDNGNQGVRTRLVVLGGLPLHSHDFQHALENAQFLDQGSIGERFSDARALTAFAREEIAKLIEQRSKSGTETENMFRPVHNRGQDDHSRISAEPRRGTLISEGHHFRISANPHQRARPIPDSLFFRILNSESTKVTGAVDADAELLDLTPMDPSESRAVM